MLEIAASEHKAGRTTRIWSDDKMFKSEQVLGRAPGVQPIKTADLIDLMHDLRYISEAEYRRTRVRYEAVDNFNPGHHGYSARLSTFDGPAPKFIDRLGVADARVGETPAFRSLFKGGGAAGIALTALDYGTTQDESNRLASRGNHTGAQSQMLHFGGRTGGGIAAGFAAGAAYGAATGSFSGPGAVATGLLAGAVGAVAGDKLMDAVDQRRIYNQTDGNGHHWQLDPKHPERGWSRPAVGSEVDPNAARNPMTGKPISRIETLHADPALADKLNYQASSKAVELALTHAPTPRNPFVQPAGPADLPAVDASPWSRDPATRQWSRFVPDPVQAAMGIASGSTERAIPGRGAELDRAAQAVIAGNIANGAEGIARRFRAAHEEYDWKRHGPVPAAVLDAEQMAPGRQKASDGHDYTRAPSGQWKTPGAFGSHTANDSVRQELDATREQGLMRRAAPTSAPALTPAHAPAANNSRSTAPEERITTHEQRITRAPGAVPFAEAYRRRDEPEETPARSMSPVGKLTKPDRMSEITLMRDLGIAMAEDQERLKDEPAGRRSAQAEVARSHDREPQQARQAQQAQQQSSPPQQHVLQQSPYEQQSAPRQALTEQRYAAPQQQQPPGIEPLQVAAVMQAREHGPQVRDVPAERLSAGVAASLSLSASSAWASPLPQQPAAGDATALQAQVEALQAQMVQLQALAQRLGRGHDAQVQIQTPPQIQAQSQSQSPAQTWSPASVEMAPFPGGFSAGARHPTSEPARLPDPRDATHPDHHDFNKILAVVTQDGRWNAEQSGNIAAQALTAFKSDPLSKQVDVVALENDTRGQFKLFVGYAPWGEHRGCLSSAAVDPVQAARVPAEQGFDTLAQVGRQRLVEEQQVQRLQQAQAPGTGLQM